MARKEIDWEVYRKIAGQAARKVARDFPGVDADDIEQTIYAKVVERQDTYKRMQYETHALFGIFVKEGVKYATEERFSALHFSDQYHYTAKEIRALCGEALFDKASFMARIEAHDARFVADPEEIVSRVLDLQTGFENLPDHYRALLVRHYVDGHPLNSSERKQLTRVIDRLSANVNVKRSKRSALEGIGSRKVVNNETARYVTQNDHSGGLDLLPNI